MAQVHSFSITAAPQVPLDAQGHATVAFTVTNVSAQTVTGQIQARALDATKQEWLKLADGAEQKFLAGQTRQTRVEVQLPPGTAPGKYPLRLDLYNSANPDEDYTQGPVVVMEAATAAPAGPAKPTVFWLRWVVVGVVLAVLGLGGWLIYRHAQKPALAPLCLLGPPAAVERASHALSTGGAQVQTGGTPHADQHVLLVMIERERTTPEATAAIATLKNTPHGQVGVYIVDARLETDPTFRQSEKRELNILLKGINPRGNVAVFRDDDPALVQQLQSWFQHTN